MAKDPAFLFYSSDFLTGTQFLNDEETGQYIRLLCLQHQHGHLPEKYMLRICGSRDSDVIKKFAKDDNGLYYNRRLELEAGRRATYCDSRRKNAVKKIEQKDPAESNGKKNTPQWQGRAAANKAKQEKTREHLFCESDIYDIAQFRAVFGAAHSKYKLFNHDYYYELIMSWADAGQIKSSNWTATARTFMLRDSRDKKAVLQGQNLLATYEKTNNREQQYEAVERALAARYSGHKGK